MFDKSLMAKKYSEKYHAAFNTLTQRQKNIVKIMESGTWAPRPDREWYSDWIKKIASDAELSYEEDKSGKLKKVKLK